MNKVFIDGQVGTTGLQIHQALKGREDLELIEIPERDRKLASAKLACINEADVVILCLPDDASRETVELAGDQTRFIDASTAHRTDPAWVYGLPEFDQSQREHIKNALRVTNPGCWPTGFLALIKPLMASDILSRVSLLNVNGVSGFSGGGRQLIQKYVERATPSPGQTSPDLWSSRPYGLQLAHKHLPEMKYFAGLDYAPLFQPSVGHFYKGMLVSVPLFGSQLNIPCDPEKITKLLNDYYATEPCVTVHSANPFDLLDEGFLDPQSNNGTNRLDLFVFGHQSQLVLTARLDNLGKGASGAAVQNLNLMLGFDELAGLTLQNLPGEY